MKLPLILPPDFDFVKQAESENALFSLLSENLSRSLEFLSYALDDEDWCFAYPNFLNRMIRWFTDLYFKDLLGPDAIRKIQEVVHQNPSALKHHLTLDIALSVNEDEYKVNSLLLAAVSPYFNRILRGDEVKKSKTLMLNVDDPEVSELLIEIAERGVQDLWRKSEAKLVALLKQTQKWEMQEAAEEAESILIRYVEPEQAVDKLKESLKLHWFKIAAKACDVFNQRPIGLKLNLSVENRLEAKFLDLKGLTTLTALESLQDEISICYLTDTLPDDPESVKAIEGIQNLWGINLTETQTPLEYYQTVPHTLRYLNLDRAGWLTDGFLGSLLSRFKELTYLSLEDQSRLSLMGLGSIAQLESLQHLNLSGQRALDDSQLSMLSIKELTLEYLNLSGCQALTPIAIQQLLGNAPKLRTLILDDTSADDRCLSEISIRLNQLIKLSLKNAPVTSKGIQSLLRQKPHLIIDQ